MMPSIEIIAAVLFALALLHTFCAAYIGRLAHRYPGHAGLLHLLGEVEMVFGLWALALVAFIAASGGATAALAYLESRNFTEPMFVFVVMVMAASRPIFHTVQIVLQGVARIMPLRRPLALAWLGLAVVPLLGSFITEPAAMTIAALMLASSVFRPSVREPVKYFALGALFVNVSIGGTLTSYAAPPVLMVAKTWGWDTLFMLTHFGWKSALAVVINASIATWLLRRQLPDTTSPADAGDSGRSDKTANKMPWAVMAIHLALLAGVIAAAHHAVVFMGIFLLFLGFTQAYARYQSRLILRESLMVACFLAGLVVLGGIQQWWLRPIIEALSPVMLFFGAVGLTAITDNAALTYLGSLVEGISSASQYMLVAGAVAGGGLTVIANAPNPAGMALLKHGFKDQSVGVGPLFLGALLPTTIAAALLLLA